MKTRATAIACMVSFAFLLAVPSALAQADKLVGVWKLIEVKLPQMGDRDAQTITDPGTSIDIFTKQHYMYMGVRGEKPRPNLPQNPTDAQEIQAFRPFDGEGGTYEVEGSTITYHRIVAKNPNDMNSQESYTQDFRFEGEALIISFKPAAKWPAPIELKFTRLE